MPSYRFADLAAARVSSGGTTAPASGTSESWTVSTTTGIFPTLLSGEVFDIIDPAVPTELMTVTATASASWTVTRGAYGTTPLVHSAGFLVRNVVTSAGLGALGNGTSLAAQRIMRPVGNRAVVMGDSLSSYGNASKVDTAAVNGAGWFNRLCVGSFQRVQRHKTFGVPGVTAQQCHDVQLPQVLALNPLPNAAFICIGTNDTSTGFDLQTKVAAPVADMVAQLRAAGVVPVLCTLPPRGAQGVPTATIAANVQIVNRWLVRFANSQGIPSVDFYGPLVHTSGGIKTAYAQGDGTHLSEVGYRQIALDAITRKVPELFPYQRPLTVKETADTSDLLGGIGLFTTGGWTAYPSGGATSTVTYPAAGGGDDLAGAWAQIVRPANDTGDILFTTGNKLGSSAVGDVLALSGRIQATGWDAAAGGNYAVQLHFTSAGAYVPAVNNWLTDTTDGTFYVEATVPAGATNCYVEAVLHGAIGAGGPVTLRLGELALRNLTALGIAGI